MDVDAPYEGMTKPLERACRDQLARSEDLETARAAADALRVEAVELRAALLCALPLLRMHLSEIVASTTVVGQPYRTGDVINSHGVDGHQAAALILDAIRRAQALVRNTVDFIDDDEAEALAPIISGEVAL